MYIQLIRRISETINSTDRRGYVVDPCRCHDLRGFLGDGFKDVLWFHHIVPRKFGETIQVNDNLTILDHILQNAWLFLPDI